MDIWQLATLGQENYETIHQTAKIAGADPGGPWGFEIPLQKYIREVKRMMYWYKN